MIEVKEKYNATWKIVMKYLRLQFRSKLCWPDISGNFTDILTKRREAGWNVSRKSSRRISENCLSYIHGARVTHAPNNSFVILHYLDDVRKTTYSSIQRIRVPAEPTSKSRIQPTCSRILPTMSRSGNNTGLARRHLPGNVYDTNSKPAFARLCWGFSCVHYAECMCELQTKRKSAEGWYPPVRRHWVHFYHHK